MPRNMHTLPIFLPTARIYYIGRVLQHAKHPLIVTLLDFHTFTFTQTQHIIYCEGLNLRYPLPLEQDIYQTEFFVCQERFMAARHEEG